MSKQPSNIDPGAGDAPEGSKQEQYGTFRLDALGVSGTGSMIESPPKRRVPVQAMVLAVLVVVAAGALYAMRRLGMGPIGAIAEVKIDYNYDKSGGDSADHEKLLADLSTSQVEHQVPADQVQKNPFRMPVLHPELPAQTKVEPNKPSPEELARIQRQKDIADALKTLQVHSVLSGAIPVARIGDENVRVGDVVATYFTVVSIGGREVEIQADGQVYTLSLDDIVAGAKPKAKTSKTKK
jgi:hypothetical protein